jgi:hypothetical protein
MIGKTRKLQSLPHQKLRRQCHLPRILQAPKIFRKNAQNLLDLLILLMLICQLGLAIILVPGQKHQLHQLHQGLGVLSQDQSETFSQAPQEFRFDTDLIRETLVLSFGEPRLFKFSHYQFSCFFAIIIIAELDPKLFIVIYYLHVIRAAFFSSPQVLNIFGQTCFFRIFFHHSFLGPKD